MKKLNLLAVSIQTALFAGAITSFATVAAEKDKKNVEEEEIERVEVTGSRIKRTDIEGPAPVVTITAVEMEDAGFNNVYDALQNLSFATGQVVGEQSANSSQTAGQAINLRGLGPGAALTLLNGRRVTDNPTASYNGGSFFDFSLIPMAAVKRIEIMTGGASAIYGSDAVAGVINVILKDDIEENYVSYEYGQATEGGRETNKIQFVGGYNTDKLSLTGIFEYQEQEGLYALDKSAFDRPDDDPNGVENGATIGWHYINANRGFVNPTLEECQRIVPTAEDRPYFPTNPARGNACFEYALDNYTLKNPRTRVNAIATAKYELTDETQLFGSVLGWKSETDNQIFRKGLRYNGLNSEGQAIQAYRAFDYDDVKPGNVNEKETFVVRAGAKGVFAGDYDWEFGTNYSRSNEFDKNRQFKRKAVTEWMQKTNYNPFAPFTSADLSEDSIGDRWADATASSFTADFSVTGDLMELSTGVVQFATIIEYQHSEYEIEVDEIAKQGQDIEGGWTNGSADFGAGQRDRYSVGVELSVPLHETVNMTIATRYDDYHDKSAVGGRPTSQLSFTYRPVDELMLRASASQSFRAPDMHYLFRERGDGFFPSVTDVYECRKAGDYPDCINHQASWPRALEEGNPNLKEEDGQSYNLGLVAEPFEGMNLTVDYFDIRLENRVVIETTGRLTSDEANCRLGIDLEGVAYDINSAECQRALSKVERDEDGDISRVKPSYVNQAGLRQTGWDISANYGFDTENAGDFNVKLGLTLVTKYESKEIDEWRDIRDTSREPRSNMNVQFSWNLEDVGASFTVFRKGGILRNTCYRGYNEDGAPIYDGQSTCNDTYINDKGAEVSVIERMDPYYTANMTAWWRINENHRLNLSVSNITDELGQEDATEANWPWRNQNVYDLTGRYASLKYSYIF